MTESPGIRFLVVDDEESIRRLCVTVAGGLGFKCMEASNGQAALSLLEEQPAHIILTDLVMPQMSGIEFLDRARKMLPRAEVAVMTGHGSVETAVQAMKLGPTITSRSRSRRSMSCVCFCAEWQKKFSWSKRMNSFANALTPKLNCTAS